MLKKLKRALVLLTATVLLVAGIPGTALADSPIDELNTNKEAAPLTAAGDIVTDDIQQGDTIYYGSYPRTLVEPPVGAPDTPSNKETYSDANGEKYIYFDSPGTRAGNGDIIDTDAYDGWYKYEPIGWRVLEHAI